MTHFPETILSSLHDMETDIFGHGNPKCSRGSITRRWWIQQDGESYISRCISTFQKLRQLEKLGNLNLPRKVLLLANGLTSTKYAGIHADAVYFKSNVRAFYLTRRMTFKFPYPLNLTHLKNEVDARHLIKETNEIKLPRLISAPQINNVSYILEELVSGIPLSETDVDDQLAKRIWKFYEKNSIVAMPLPAVIDLTELKRSITEASNFLHYDEGLVLEVLDQSEVVKRSESSYLPVGRCHGDLGVSNLLGAAGQIFFLDLERSTIGFLWEDLAKLSLQSASFFYGADESYCHWCQRLNLPLHSARELLIIGLSNAVHRYWRERSKNHVGSKLNWTVNRLQRRLFRLHSAVHFVRATSCQS